MILSVDETVRNPKSEDPQVTTFSTFQPPLGTEDSTGVVCAQQQAMRGPGAMRGRGMR